MHLHRWGEDKQRRWEVLFSNSVLLTLDLNIADPDSRVKQRWKEVSATLEVSEIHSCSSCCTQWAGRPAATKGCFKKWCRGLLLRNLHITGKLVLRGRVFGWLFPSAVMAVHPAVWKVCASWQGQHIHGAWFGCCSQARMEKPETAAEAEAT